MKPGIESWAGVKISGLYFLWDFPFQEDPYIMLDQPTACTPTKGTICQMVPDSQIGKHSYWIIYDEMVFSGE